MRSSGRTRRVWKNGKNGTKNGAIHLNFSCQGETKATQLVELSIWMDWSARVDARASINLPCKHFLPRSPNRAVARLMLFEQPGNDEAFGRITEDAVDQSRILLIISWTLMPNDQELVRN